MGIARHVLVVTATVLCVSAALLAQVPLMPPPAIEWSAARKLTREDFNGEVPETAKFQSRSWIRIEASWRCISSILNASVAAVFDPGRSWWLGSQWNPWEDVDSRRKWLSWRRS